MKYQPLSDYKEIKCRFNWETNKWEAKVNDKWVSFDTQEAMQEYIRNNLGIVDEHDGPSGMGRLRFA